MLNTCTYNHANCVGDDDELKYIELNLNSYVVMLLIYMSGFYKEIEFKIISNLILRDVKIR